MTVQHSTAQIHELSLQTTQQTVGFTTNNNESANIQWTGVKTTTWLWRSRWLKRWLLTSETVLLLTHHWAMINPLLSQQHGVFGHDHLLDSKHHLNLQKSPTSSLPMNAKESQPPIILPRDYGECPLLLHHCLVLNLHHRWPKSPCLSLPSSRSMRSTSSVAWTA